ncbi:MAG: NYN domain-containing protein [Patescibacteria group bacterium]
MANPEQRVAVFIDGGNFYFKLKELGIKNISHFGYRQLAEWLARDRKVAYAGYYVGVVRAKSNDVKGQKLRAGQVNLFNFLRSKEQLFEIRQGYLMKSDGVYHEKGVDVQLAVDLLVGAYDNTYDTAILLSSDTDLIPAVKKVKELGKSVEYIGFAHHPTIALQTRATLSRLLIKEEIEPFVAKEQMR